MNRQIIAAVMLFGLAGNTTAQVMTCQSSATKAAQLRTATVDYASSTDYADSRTSIGLTTAIDTSTIAIVTVDSVCDAVTRGVNTASESARSTALLVVKFGAFYAACDATAGYMVDPIYILDDHYHLRTILTPGG